MRNHLPEKSFNDSLHHITVGIWILGLAFLGVLHFRRTSGLHFCGSITERLWVRGAVLHFRQTSQFAFSYSKIVGFGCVAFSKNIKFSRYPFILIWCPSDILAESFFLSLSLSRHDINDRPLMQSSHIIFILL